jgi:DNA-binding MarR family transcriptional regulator
MSRTVSALVERRLIARSEDPTDRRRVLLHLTEEGCTLFLQLHGDIETVLARQIANLSAEERDRLAAGLDVLHRLFADHSPATAEDEEATRHSQRSGYVTNEEVQ